MESKTDDALKARFFVVRKEIYNRFTVKQQGEHQTTIVVLKRSMTECERESEVIEIDTDITVPGTSKKTNRTVTDMLIKKPSHEDFVEVWSETVLDKGLTFDFFSDPLVHKDILVTEQCVDSIITFFSTYGKDTLLLVTEIRTLDQENVFSFTMDGACKGAFPIIQERLPWVQCFVCPSHTIDGFIKNALSDTSTIRIQTNVMRHVEFDTIAWGETVFKNTYETVCQVVLTLVSHQKPLDIYHNIASQPEFSQVGVTETLKYVVTRFGNKVRDKFMNKFRKIGKMVGSVFKTIKSEFVVWEEEIRGKKCDLCDKKHHDQPEGVFTERNMNRSQQDWVKTFMQDVMDENGQVLFDNLTWFVKKLCYVMTSACEHM